MADEVDPKIIADYEASLRKLRVENDKNLKDTKKSFDERVKISKKEFSDRRASIRDTYRESTVRKKLISLLEDEEDEFEKNLKQREKERKLIGSVSSALGGLYGAAERGEGTISSFTSVFKGRGVLGDAFSALGTRLDTNIETFRQLSQTGANFGQSIVQMRVAAGQALLPLDDFASLVAQNSQNLAALFGSTTEGAKAIASLSEGMRTASVESLAPLGFTVDEINSTLLLNLERQRRTFNFDANARTQNIQSALNFAKQLDRLAKLTGTQREELQKQIEQQMSNERFQAFLGGQTREVGQRLENFAATIGSISPELNEGFQDLIANAGRPVTDAAIQLVQNMPEVQAAIQNLIAGTTTSEQALMSIRNAAIKSQDRFRQATVTGTVEFLRLQSGVIKLGSTQLDLNAVLAEQAKLSPRLTQGLTEFQDATKRLSGQFQKIETGLLAGFGPALGGLVDFTTGGMKLLGGIVEQVAKVPMLSGTLLLGGLVGKYLFSRGEQILIMTTAVRAGTAHLTAALGGQSLGQQWAGAKGAAGRAPGMIGQSLKGTFGGFKALGGSGGGAGAGSRMLRMGGGIGAALGGAMAIGNLMDKDKKNDMGAIGTLIGTGIGILGGPLGMMLGGMAGGAIGGMFDGKQYGGPMGGGNPHLVGEAGPEIVMTKSASSVTSNTELKKLFNTEGMEKHLMAIATSVSPVAKVLHSVHESLNTGNMINNKTRIATEKSARVDPNRVGLV